MRARYPAERSHRCQRQGSPRRPWCPFHFVFVVSRRRLTRRASFVRRAPRHRRSRSQLRRPGDGISPANATLGWRKPVRRGERGAGRQRRPRPPGPPAGQLTTPTRAAPRRTRLCPTVEEVRSRTRASSSTSTSPPATPPRTGDTFLYLAFDRLETPNQNGTVAIDFELNQSARPRLNGVNPAAPRATSSSPTSSRAALKLAVIVITVWTWDGDKWGGETVLRPQPGRRARSVPSATFGEMAINLEKAGIFKEGQCDNFASVFTKGRSSSSSVPRPPS